VQELSETKDIRRPIHTLYLDKTLSSLDALITVVLTPIFLPDNPSLELQMKLGLRVFPLDHSPGFLIYRTAAKLKAGLSRAFQTAGFEITPEQWSVLSRLWEAEGLSQTTLAERACKDRHNMTRILNRLEQSGLVRREPNLEDKRFHKIFLTEEGRALKKKLIPIVESHLLRAMSGLSQEDLKQLERIHEHIVNNFSIENEK
jgi:DNA-binding MarR family transcriptional regulator